MSEEQIKHLEFIQNVITRMNANSFQIKGWTTTIVVALLAIYVSTKNEYFVMVSLFPIIVFWFLDSYYLMQERKFRGLYNDVAGVSEDPKTIKLFEMRPDLYIGGKYTFFDVFTSQTILKMYLPMVLLISGIFLYLKVFFKGGL